MTPTLVLAAHGTRDPDWQAVLESLACLVRRTRPGSPVELGFLEISSPSLAEVLPAVPGPVVVVPLLLTGGYHAHIDLPEVVARCRPDAVVAHQLGPHRLLTSVLVRRLAAAGLRSRDAVILGAAGSTDPAALDDVRVAARLLSVRLSRPVTAAFASAGTPTVHDSLRSARSGLATRVAVASYLLGPGSFHNRLVSSGADLVSAPLGVDDDVASLVWARYDEAVGRAVQRSVPRSRRRRYRSNSAAIASPLASGSSAASLRSSSSRT